MELFAVSRTVSIPSDSNRANKSRAEIKNPVSLARLILDHANQPLSLRRVPPIFLVGQGATDFAYEHGMSVLPPEFLVSPAARDRWRKWRDDLERAERNRQREEAQRYGISHIPSESDMIQYQDHKAEYEQARQAHVQAMKAGVWNEAQPISPPPSDKIHARDRSSSPSQSASLNSMEASDDTRHTTPDSPQSYIDPYGPPGMLDSSSTNPFANSTQKMPTPHTLGLVGSHSSSDGGVMSQRQSRSDIDLSDLHDPDHEPLMHMQQSPRFSRWNDGSSGSDSDSTTVALNLRSLKQSPILSDREGLQNATLFPYSGDSDENTSKSSTPTSQMPSNATGNRSQIPAGPHHVNDGSNSDDEDDDDDDDITDTVGAIAIDLYGNIACAASSGGIGMKHRGRIGPASSVGTGAAVHVADKDDPDRVTVATVTSGTGEHMTTTAAAHVCSQHVYQSWRKISGGRYEDCTEDEAVKAFIDNDFMGHPSVQRSHSTGAIGVLSVKSTKDGAYLYYGHNTDSFALASMHSNESKPVCTMSRSKGNGIVAQGGRMIRNRKRKA